MSSPSLTAGSGRSRSTAQDQRARIIACAVQGFSGAGYHATPVTEIADRAEVSPAYVFRLFKGKLGLFVATVDSCYQQVVAALTAGGQSAHSSDPEVVLDAMTVAYVELINDRDLIMIQVHAQSACDVPEIRDSVRRGVAAVVEAVAGVSGAPSSAVQRFIAYGQLCHLIVQARLGDLPDSWATGLTAGIQHNDHIARH